MSPTVPTQTRPAHPWVVEGQERVRFGIFGRPGSDWGADLGWVRTVEEFGFDSYWVGDHPVEFERVRLGTLVTCAPYSHPLMLARQAADVDRASRGRLVPGLGTGDARREFAPLGLSYGKARERQELLEEVLWVIPALWAGESVTFEGRHVRPAGARVSAGPVQRP